MAEPALVVSNVKKRYANGTEALPDLPALRAFLDEHEISGARSLSGDDLEEVHALRPRLRAVWAARDMRTAAAVVNAKDFIVERAHRCARERGALPNFVAVSFYGIGDVLGAVDELNGVGRP